MVAYAIIDIVEVLRYITTNEPAMEASTNKAAEIPHCQ